MQIDIQKRIQETDKKLKEVPSVARQHKASDRYDCLDMKSPFLMFSLWSCF